MSFAKALVAALSLSVATVDALRPSLHGRAHSNWRHHNAVRPRATSYTLKDKFDASNILDEFEFWNTEDPTHGSVNYLGKDEATSKGLAYVDNGVVVLAVDDKTWLPSGGNRDSVRISSKANYDNGLFIADFEAMPWGCSVWPAYWSNGPNWPAGGEIDVLEGVNEGTTNQYTLHTSDGCSASLGNAKVTATVGNAKCASANGDNAGCAYFDTDNRSYGKGFNEAGGGVYAHLIDSSGIKIWFFSRSDVPKDITDGNPDPASWDSPAAFWATETCDTASHFYSQQLIIDTTLCGDWAGSSFNSDGCSGSCADTVADPGNFKNAKWRINSIKVYESGGKGGDDSGSDSGSGAGSSDGASSTEWRGGSETISASLGLTISAGNVNAPATTEGAATSTAWSSAASATSTASPDDDEDCDEDEEDESSPADEDTNDWDDGEDCEEGQDGGEGDNASATASSATAGASATGSGSSSANNGNSGDNSDEGCDEDEGASATATGAAAASSSSGTSLGGTEDEGCDEEEGSNDGARAATSAGASNTDAAEGASATGASDDEGDDCDEGGEATATATGSAAASTSSSAEEGGDCDEGEWSYSASASASAFPSASGSAFPSASASAFPSGSASASGSAPSAGSGSASFYQPSGSASFGFSSSAPTSAPAATTSPECTESA